MMDRVEIVVRGGDGGNGCIAFRREKHAPRGGPVGGDGGRGGAVRLVANPAVTTLIDQHFSQRYEASRGGHGQGKGRHGAHGPDVLVSVPVGTAVFDADTGEPIADLTRDGQEWLAARGGIGGRGNARFKSSTYRAPRVAERGEPGEERRLRLEVRLIADVGLIGLPNTGKSTLLAHVSAARPKIGDYPFTTLEPHLGVVRIGPEQHFVLADLPGLVEGAHAGVGLGHDFLRHVERTRLLLHVLDAGAEERDPLHDFHAINRELRLHGAAVAHLPQVVVLNKMDLSLARQRLAALREGLRGVPVWPVSAATGERLEALMRDTYARLAAARAREAARALTATSPDPVGFRPRPRVRVRCDGDVFRVDGDTVRRAVAMTDMTNPEAVWLLHRRLASLGVLRSLRRAGAQEGDVVFVGDTELVFSDAPHAGTFADFVAGQRQTPRREGRDQHADGGHARAR
jgi:GTP-binding protein